MTKDEWRRLTSAQAQSGKSIAEFCGERGVKEKTFGFSKSKLKSDVGFVQVSGARSVELKLPSGVVLGVSVEDLPRVLRALDA